MVIPEHQDGKKDDSLIAFQKVTDVVSNTRQAGGQQTENIITPRIVVDMREFRSDLPCLIHRRGIQVVPVTITVKMFRSGKKNRTLENNENFLTDWRLYSHARHMR